jgi:hypothetical protein
MPSKRLEHLLQKEMTRKDFLNLSFLVLISSFGVYGVVTKLLSDASSPYSSTDAANGTLNNGATLVKDSSSGDEVVKFETSPPTQVPITLGVFVGSGPDQPGTSGANSFKAATGANITLLNTDLPWDAGPVNGATGWGYLTNLTNGLGSWMSPYAGTSYQMIIDIPMVCLDSSGNAENTLDQGASSFTTTLSSVGSSLQTIWTEIAENLVTLGFGNAILRLGWEFDGNGYYPWQIANSTDATNFAAYWRNIVTAMRSVSGANFKFWWTPAGFYATELSLTQAIVEQAYPGSAYADGITLDLYDQYYFNNATLFPPNGIPDNTCTSAQSNAVFTEYESGTFILDLDWMKGFANTQGKPFGLAECSVQVKPDNHGLGDDPTFYSNIYNWYASNGATLLVFFQGPYDGSATYLLTSGNFPNSLAEVKSLFG